MRTLLLALTLLAFPASATVSKDAVFPYPLKVAQLPNGLTVARVPYPSPGLVAFYTVVRVGSRNEVEPGHSGFAHFFEHVMFKGTAKFPSGAREAQLGKVGFSDNAFTTDDVTVYHSYGPSSSLELLIQVEADRFQNLSYPEAVFQTEARAVLGEYHKNAAFPELKIEEQLNATAFKHHPYQHTTLGFYEDIQKMPDKYQYSLEFFKRWYRPDNVMIFVVGDFDDAQVMNWVGRQYGPWKGTPSEVKIPSEPPQRQELKTHIDWPSPTLPRHVHAWRTPAATATTQDAAIQTVLAGYLAGPTSPLFKHLVLEKQLAESVSSEYMIHRDPYLFIIDIKLKEEQHRAVAKKMLDAAVRDLASGKVDSKRLAAIKSHVLYSATMEMETPDDVALRLAWYAGVMGKPDSLISLYKEIDRVTTKDLVEFSKKYFTAQNRTVLTLTPKLSAPVPAEVKP